jgi:hypothetical protein
MSKFFNRERLAMTVSHATGGNFYNYQNAVYSLALLAQCANIASSIRDYMDHPMCVGGPEVFEAGMGSFLIMGLIGVIIASIVNIFLKSSGMQFVISILSVLIFTGLTAYDSQKIKNMYFQFQGSDMIGKIGIMGALSLYMDFINLFISMLQLFGQRRD